MGKRQIAALQTRQKIVEAARKLIAEKGFDAVGVSEIAEAAGVAKGSFYTYFKRKEDVVAEIAHEKFVDLEEQAKTGDSVCARLAAFLTSSIGYLADTGVHICQQWLKNVVEPEDTQGKSKLRYDIGVIRGILTAAVEQGELLPDTPVDALADQIAASYYGAIALWAITDGSFDPAAHVAQYGQHQLPTMLHPYSLS